MIKVYPAEHAIADKIIASKTVAYTSPVVLLDKLLESQRTKLVAKANEKIGVKAEHKHLHPLQTILVSTGWNRNDDVFLPEQVWAARKTPEDTPFNLEHQENTIIGHITANWVIDETGEVVEDDDEMPRQFHIVTTAVLYTLWEDENLIKRTEDILANIKAGKLYVSMECTMEDFDYAIIKGNEQIILPRNHATAFLTEHLRCFGGDGVYNSYRVGRLLKSICFSGKGLVEVPANPDSIIFNEDIVEFNTKASVDAVIGRLKNVKVVSSKTCEDNGDKKMADEANKEIAALESTVATLRTEKRELAGKLDNAELALATANKKLVAAEADAVELTKTIASLKDAVKAANDEHEATKAEWTDKFKKKEDEAEDAKSKAAKLAEEKAVIEAKAKTVARLGVLKAAASLSDEDAAKLEKQFASLDDAAFEGMVTLAKASVKAEKDVPVAEMFTVAGDGKVVAGAGSGVENSDKAIQEGIWKALAGHGMKLPELSEKK
jgi:predicted  nucleic acid-binding Zn-ribbon protein